MARIVENPEGIDSAYLDHLNVCFPASWNAESYRWYLKRPFGSRLPDIVTVYDDDKLVAGMGINYRWLTLPHGCLVDVAVLTAAWTLPAYQGSWHFMRLIKASKNIARAKGCLALLSFVTDENASAAVLRRAGAYALPTRYIKVFPDTKLQLPRWLPRVRLRRGARFVAANSANSAVAFHYPDSNDWRTQFLGRPHPTSVLDVAKGVAVIEHVGETDRLQFTSETSEDGLTKAVAVTARYSQRSGRGLFWFTTSESVAASAQRFGMTVGVGHVMVIDLPVETRDEQAILERLRTTVWHVQAGDRM